MRSLALLLLCLPVSTLAADVDKEEAAKQTSLAGLYAASGSWETALEARQSAVEADPDDCSTQHSLGMFYLGHGKAVEALPHLKTAVELYADWDALPLEERQEIQGSNKRDWEGIKNPFPMNADSFWEQAPALREALPEGGLTVPLVRGGPGDSASYIEVSLPDESKHLFRITLGSNGVQVSPEFAAAADAKVRKRKVGKESSHSKVTRIPQMRIGDATLHDIYADAEVLDTTAGGLPVAGQIGLRAFADGLALAMLPSEGVLVLAAADEGPALLGRVKNGTTLAYESRPTRLEKDGRKDQWLVAHQPWLFAGQIDGADATLSFGHYNANGISRQIVGDREPAWSRGTTGLHSVTYSLGDRNWILLATEDERLTRRRSPLSAFFGARFLQGMDIAIDPSSSTLALGEASVNQRDSWWDTAIANVLDEGDEDDEGEDEEEDEEEDADPEETPTEEEGPRSQSSTCYFASSALAWARIADGQFDKVMNLPYASEEIDPEIPSLVGAAMVLAGMPSESEPAYRQAARLDGRGASVGIGIAQFAQGKNEQALGNFLYGVWQKPNSLQRANLYAEATALGQGMNEAVEAMAVLAATDPQNATWALAAARTLAMVGRDSTQALDHAIGLFETQIAHTPTCEVIGQYALALVLAERYDEATIMADVALKTAPNSPSALLTLARMASNEGHLDFAIQLRKRAAMSNLDDPAYATLLMP